MFQNLFLKSAEGTDFKTKVDTNKLNYERDCRLAREKGEPLPDKALYQSGATSFL